MDGEEGKETRTIDEKGRGKRRKTHACLKVHSWYWNPAWKTNRLLSSPSTHCLSSPHPPPSSIFAPSTICFIIVNSTGSLSLCSTNNRLLIIRSSLVEDFGISMEEISFNRYRYRPLPFPFLSRKHLENEHENN